MKRFALSLVIVLASAVSVFAAAKTADSSADRQAAQVANANATSGQKIQAKAGARAPEAKDGPKAGDITITGKAGSEAVVDYGQGAKPEAKTGGAKTSGQ